MNAGKTNQPLRLGIACYPTHGGSGVLATELGVALAERGHEVHFLAYSRPPRLLSYHPRVFCHQVEVSTYPLFRYPPYDLALASKMIEVVKDRRLEVLHVHYAIPHSISAYLARELLPGRRLGVVTTLHGTDITLVGAGSAYRDVTRFGIEKSDRVIAVSEFLRGETLRIFGCSKEFEVVPNFVDTTRFQPRPPAEERLFDVPEGHQVVLHVSNFRPVKRVLDSVRAFATACQGQPVTLVLAGDGPEREEAARLVAERDLKDQVLFLGTIDDISSILPSANILLTSSEQESFGLAALEALSCGVPVVGYDVGGMSEVIEDGTNGFLVRSGDIPALAGRLSALLNDPQLASDFGARGRQRAVEEFDLQHILAIHEKIYREAIDTP